MDHDLHSTLESSIHILQGKNSSRECAQLTNKLKILIEMKTLEPTKRNVMEIVDIISASIGALGSTTTWMTHFLTENNLQIVDEKTLSTLMGVLENTLNEEDLISISNVLQLTVNISKVNPRVVGLHWGKLIRCIPQVFNHLVYNDEDLAEEFLVLAVQRLDTILGCLLEAQFKIEKFEIDILAEVATALLQIHYKSEQQIKHASRALAFGISSLKLLNKVVIVSTHFAETNVGFLIGLTKAYIHFGYLDTESRLPLPQKVYASQQAIADTSLEDDAPDNGNQSRSNGGKILKKRKPRTMLKNSRHSDLTRSQQLDTTDIAYLITTDMKTSDSENSDLECAVSRTAGRDSYIRTKLRFSSIVLLGSVTRDLNRRTLYGYWHTLFPCLTQTDLNCGLFHVAQHDHSVRCRSASLQVIAQVLLDSKILINMAESGRSNSTFLSFSVNLGNIIEAMYEDLEKILQKEASLPVLTQALKCLAVLVQATSFQKLKFGIVTRFMYKVKPLIYHRDSTIQVSALMVMEFLLARPELTTEMSDSLGLQRLNLSNGWTADQNDNPSDFVNVEQCEEFIESDDDTEHNSQNNTNCDKKARENTKFLNDSSWLLLRALHNLSSSAEMKNKISTSVSIESLQLISAMITHLTRLNIECLDGISDVLQNVLQDPLSEVRLYAGRCLDNCAYHISQHILKKVDDVEICKKFWVTILPVLTKQLSRESVQVSAYKVCLCDAISNIGSVIFERLPHTTQMNLICFLSGISNDNIEADVAAAAVRAMAVFVLFPSLRENLVFIENTAESILRLVHDSNMIVRVKTFWALGNVSDSLISIHTSMERISDDLLKRLINAATSACSDCDKVRWNAVRALGNLLLLLDAHQLDDISSRNFVQKAILKLTDCVRMACNAKVKWNACYAIGNMLQNSALFEATERYPTDLEWKITLYQSLAHVIAHHPNFKVRINAAAAMVNVKHRNHYGNSYEMLWSVLLVAMEQSNNLDNFYEYNHRDQLQEQLCRTCCHFILHATEDDFIFLKKHLAEKSEIVRNIWMRVINRMVPEKAAPLLACSVLLRERFKDSIQLSVEQSNAIHFIVETLALL